MANRTAYGIFVADSQEHKVRLAYYGRPVCKCILLKGSVKMLPEARTLQSADETDDFWNLNTPAFCNMLNLQQKSVLLMRDSFEEQ